MINIVVPAYLYMGWGGGTEFIINLISSLNYMNNQGYISGTQITVVLDEKNRVFNDEAVNRIKAISTNISLYYNAGKLLRDVLKDIDADILLPMRFMIRNINVPQVLYIPDLQEEYFKDFFSYEEILLRRKTNRYLLSEMNHILITSRSVKKDIEKYYDYPQIEYHIQPCFPLSNRDFWDTSDVDLSRYKLPNDYFIISNQFWKHKDHLTAFKALKCVIKELKQKVYIVCTGLMEDNRDPDYVNVLNTYIKNNDLEDCVFLLGHIPRGEQLEIMKRSNAVIQATLFEGGAGGFSAQEAIAYGKDVILSDIEINRELSDFSEVHFFSHGNYFDLADKMKKLYKRNNMYSIKKTQNTYEDHIDRLAKFYADTITRVIDNER